jgi:hypothetical protein
MAIRNWKLECATRIYSVTLHLYPKQFRNRFGSEMTYLFRNHWQAVALESGKFGILAWLFEIMMDLVSSLGREHLHSLRRRIDGGTVSVSSRDMMLVPGLIAVNLLPIGPLIVSILREMHTFHIPSTLFLASSLVVELVLAGMGILIAQIAMRRRAHRLLCLKLI